MRLSKLNRQSGYSVLEALIACALTMILVAGVTKLSSVGKEVTVRAFSSINTPCQDPVCSQGASRIVCSCDAATFTVIP